MSSTPRSKCIEVSRCFFDGSCIIASDYVPSQLIRVSVTTNESGQPYFERFTIYPLAAENFSSENCRSIVRCNSLLGIMGIPFKFSKSDAISFYLVLVSHFSMIGYLRGLAICRISDVKFIPIKETEVVSEDTLAELRRFLTSGCFYYAQTYGENVCNFDLTMTTQFWYNNFGTNKNFFWNKSWYLPFLRSGINADQWIVKIICGGVERFDIYISCKFTLWIISRMGSNKAGTRYNVRGVNDDGYVANFVETEQLLIKYNGFTESTSISSSTFDLSSVEESSFVIIRGSIPVFWHQSSLQVGSHRLSFSRDSALTLPAFLLHFQKLIAHYGDVFVLSLASNQSDEGKLSRAYVEMFKNILVKLPPNCKAVRTAWFVLFDYHEHLRNVRNLSTDAFVESYMMMHNDCRTLLPFLTSHGVFIGKHGIIYKSQSGIVRVNCIDCLDRTNSVQYGLCLAVLFKMQLPSLLQDTRFSSITITSIRTNYEKAWLNNGDHISKIYAGSAALCGKSRATDMKRSISRALQNSLFDYNKNAAMDTVIHSYFRIPKLRNECKYHLSSKFFFADESILATLLSNRSQYTVKRTIRVSISTWNINGDKYHATETNRLDPSNKTATLKSWLLDGPSELIAQLMDPNLPIRCTGHVDADYSEAVADIYAIGFQEICDITAASMVKASEENMLRWCDMMNYMLNSEEAGGSRYVLIGKDQLVGVCLFIFIKEDLIPFFRYPQFAKVKTGFRNQVGNKGCVAAKFCLFNTSLCFICAHFEAGQKEVSERNNNYRSIINHLTESFEMPVLSNDYIFFFGDFNYRINLTRKEVLDNIENRNYLPLLSADQLFTEKSDKKIFENFSEGPILFDPTYKYDYHSQLYDTSEKARIPSWCDRILWRRNFTGEKNARIDQGKLLYYGRAELMTSDHRPVTAVLDIELNQNIDENLMNMYNSLRLAYSPLHACVVLEAPVPVTKRTYVNICDKLGPQLKDTFATVSTHSSQILLFFRFPEQARIFVELGDEILEEGIRFKKRMMPSPVSLQRLENDLLFGSEQEKLRLSKILVNDEMPANKSKSSSVSKVVDLNNNDNCFDHCTRAADDTALKSQSEPDLMHVDPFDIGNKNAVDKVKSKFFLDEDKNCSGKSFPSVIDDDYHFYLSSADKEGAVLPDSNTNDLLSDWNTCLSSTLQQNNVFQFPIPSRNAPVPKNTTTSNTSTVNTNTTADDLLFFPGPMFVANKSKVYNDVNLLGDPGTPP